MYSAPYSFDWHTNWCGVGIFDINRDVDFFQLMYYDGEDTFRRKGFYHDSDELRFEGDDQFEVSATMATHHTPDIKVLTLFSSKKTSRTSGR